MILENLIVIFSIPNLFFFILVEVINRRLHVCVFPMIINMLILVRKIAVLSNVRCLCLNNDRHFLLIGNLSTGKKVHLIRRINKTETTIAGHHDHILAITISTDGQFLVKIDGMQNSSRVLVFQVSGDKANLIQVWNGQTCQHLKTLRGHQGPITVMRRKGNPG